jgi:adenylate kinase
VNLVFLGPPGAGKGTQARLLSQRTGIPQISTGDILRAAIAHRTPLGREAERYVSAGELVPDAVMIGMIAERLQQSDTVAGFILDGFPRSLAQAEGLEAVLARMGRRLDRVIYFAVSEQTLVRRLSNRRVCRVCGHIYNVESNPPKTPGVCDLDGGALDMRDDDRPETLQRRLQIYRETIEPLLAFYQTRGLFTTLQAEGTVEEIATALTAALRTAGVPR